MPIEIGSLVIRGSFGAPPRGQVDAETLEKALNHVQHSILDAVEEMLEERERRAQGR